MNAHGDNRNSTSTSTQAFYACTPSSSAKPLKELVEKVELTFNIVNYPQRQVTQSVKEDVYYFLRPSETLENVEYIDIALFKRIREYLADKGDEGDGQVCSFKGIKVLNDVSKLFISVIRKSLANKLSGLIGKEAYEQYIRGENPLKRFDANTCLSEYSSAAIRFLDPEKEINDAVMESIFVECHTKKYDYSVTDCVFRLFSHAEHDDNFMPSYPNSVLCLDNTKESFLYTLSKAMKISHTIQDEKLMDFIIGSDTSKPEDLRSKEGLSFVLSRLEKKVTPVMVSLFPKHFLDLFRNDLRKGIFEYPSTINLYIPLLIHIDTYCSFVIETIKECIISESVEIHDAFTEFLNLAIKSVEWKGDAQTIASHWLEIIYPKGTSIMSLITALEDLDNTGSYLMDNRDFRTESLNFMVHGMALSLRPFKSVIIYSTYTNFSLFDIFPIENLVIDNESFISEQRTENIHTLSDLMKRFYTKPKKRALSCEDELVDDTHIPYRERVKRANEEHSVGESGKRKRYEEKSERTKYSPKINNLVIRGLCRHEGVIECSKFIYISCNMKDLGNAADYISVGVKSEFATFFKQVHDGHVSADRKLPKSNRTEEAFYRSIIGSCGEIWKRNNYAAVIHHNSSDSMYYSLGMIMDIYSKTSSKKTTSTIAVYMIDPKDDFNVVHTTTQEQFENNLTHITTYSRGASHSLGHMPVIACYQEISNVPTEILKKLATHNCTGSPVHTGKYATRPFDIKIPISFRKTCEM